MGTIVMVWAGAVTGLALFLGGAYSLVTLKRRERYDQNMFKLGGIIAILLGVVLAVWPLLWLYGTESGARALKTFDSETGGGITRVVTVYDFEGDILERYEGRFDVEWSENRLIFDMPQGDGTYKRVQIQSSTGTISIAEK